MSTIPWQRRVQYACGYIELGMLQDARTELDALPEPDRLRPEVLGVHCDLYSESKDWVRMITSGRALARVQPENAHGWISWAFALRELQRIPEARDVLLEAERQHARCANLHYNLACYYCLLGELDEAERRLRRTLEIDRTWKESALEDTDLERMHERIASL